MPTATFTCRVLTPAKPVLEREVTSVILPAHDGELGIWAGRAPLICHLGAGRLKVDGPDGTEVFLIDRGVAEMGRDELTILTREATPPAELDAEQVARELEEAAAMPLGDDMSYKERQSALNRARAARRLASSAST